jgi:hypothetical protein
MSKYTSHQNWFYCQINYYNGLIHYPDDFCFWTSRKNLKTGRAETFTYQDDGFGNLILIDYKQTMKILRFKLEDLH